ncbi:hypothetical protein BJY16_005427 [Actinoplanes octamycinicus]|uniref:DUF4333 domain-containing protein n=1 Tax=Actinoplanes octamycinicus TaxID=135948 RepID=A0A7W7H133_9ACTN|nr:hypothetical protein [Actinoplanes octamycinicus]MBB4741968.1 hypothetical protein [Actinoplanes octamycinicus]GIE60733.1 hypothetical protein Aoc01nite_61350 [Actinoplanes octamycinicus]
MRGKRLAVLGVVSVVLAGCGDGSESGSDDSVAESPPSHAVLPQRIDRPQGTPALEPSPSPGANASLSENLEYELRKKTLQMASAAGDTTAVCPERISGTAGTKVTCRATYRGLAVTWDVTLGDKPGWSQDYVSFDATPDQGLITKEGVARVLYGNFRDTIDYALCNDIPPAVLAPLNVRSQYSCEVVGKGDQPTGFADPVRATESGPRVY